MMRSSFVIACTTVLLFSVGSAQADGKATYDSACGLCHGAGVAGAPKFGDRKAWAERIVQGEDVLFKHALEGFQGKSGFMPPKGGFTQLTDDEVKAALQYIVQNSQ